jgi:radical SAM modification target selenobiotic family peptide
MKRERFMAFLYNSKRTFREVAMERKDLKKLLASLGVASLISMGGVALPGANAGSG